MVHVVKSRSSIQTWEGEIGITSPCGWEVALTGRCPPGPAAGRGRISLPLLSTVSRFLDLSGVGVPLNTLANAQVCVYLV